MDYRLLLERSTTPMAIVFTSSGGERGERGVTNIIANNIFGDTSGVYKIPFEKYFSSGEESTGSGTGGVFDFMNITHLGEGVFCVDTRDERSIQFDCIKTIIEEFGKMLAFVFMPQPRRGGCGTTGSTGASSRWSDIEVVYINKNFAPQYKLKSGKKSITAFSDTVLCSKDFIRIFENFLSDPQKKLARTTDKKMMCQYFFARNGDHIGIFGKDISSEIREKELSDKILQTRNEFMGHISHEIRTPLNGIIASIEMMEMNEGLPSSVLSHIETLGVCSTQLLTIINDLMDLSRMEAKKLTLQHQPFSVNTLISSALHLVETASKKKNIDIIIDLDPKLSTEYVGDNNRIRQIIVNLLTNAIKFSSQNTSVTLRITKIENVTVPSEIYDDVIPRFEEVFEASETSSGSLKKSSSSSPKTLQLDTITFSIIDKGIGIPKSRHNELFQPFSQISSTVIPTAYSSGEGIGLGLNICKNLVELMNGGIQFFSEENKGSTFSFTIRLPIYTKLGDVEMLCGKRILVVDDNSVSLKFIASVLSKHRAICLCYSGVSDALEMCLQNNIELDLIITDICLPVMSGVDFSKKIRECGYITTPIIGISSLNVECVDDNFFNLLIQKPFSSNDLINNIIYIFTSSGRTPLIKKRNGGSPLRPTAACSGYTTTSGGSVLKTPVLKSNSLKPSCKVYNKVSSLADLDILIVEDIDTNIRVTQEQLALFGIKKTDVALDGSEALLKVSEKRYHIVLMDISIPRINGIECTEKILDYYDAHRSNEYRPYIIGITANTNSDVLDIALKSGMSKILTKPIRLGELKAVVNLAFNNLK